MDALARSNGTSIRSLEDVQSDNAISVLKISMLVPTKEMQLWHEQQRKDPTLIDIIRQREEWQGAGKEFELTPEGLLHRMQGGRRNIMVSVSL